MAPNKAHNAPGRVSGCLTFEGEAGHAEIGALVCDVLLLCVFVYNQVFYGLDMWFAIVPLALIGVGLVFVGIIPETYRLTDTALEVWHLRRRTAAIPYDAVFNLEVKVRDGFAELLQENSVKVYHQTGKARRLTVLRPRNASGLAAELKSRCPEFSEDPQQSKLNVFFEKQE